jgi:predicted DNA-binding transcriptional regulator AlpA
MTHQTLRLPDPTARVALSCSSNYQLIAEGRFPQPILPGGPRAVGWIDPEVGRCLTNKLRVAVRHQRDCGMSNKQGSAKAVQAPAKTGATAIRASHLRCLSMTIGG